MAIERWEMLLSSRADRYILKVRGPRADVDKIINEHRDVCQDVQEISDDVFQWVIFVVAASQTQRLAIQNQLVAMTVEPGGQKPSLELSDMLMGLSDALEGLTNLTEEEHAFVLKKMQQVQGREAAGPAPAAPKMAPPPARPAAPPPPPKVPAPVAKAPAPPQARPPAPPAPPQARPPAPPAPPQARPPAPPAPPQARPPAPPAPPQARPPAPPAPPQARPPAPPAPPQARPPAPPAPPQARPPAPPAPPQARPPAPPAPPQARPPAPPAPPQARPPAPPAPPQAHPPAPPAPPARPTPPPARPVAPQAPPDPGWEYNVVEPSLPPPAAPPPRPRAAAPPPAPPVYEPPPAPPPVTSTGGLGEIVLDIGFGEPPAPPRPQAPPPPTPTLEFTNISDEFHAAMAEPQVNITPGADIEPLSTPMAPPPARPPQAATPSPVPPPEVAPSAKPAPAADDGAFRMGMFYQQGAETPKVKFMNTLKEMAQKKSKKPMSFELVVDEASGISADNATDWIWKARSQKADCFFVILPPDVMPDFMESVVNEARQAGLRCFLIQQAEIASKLLYMDLMVELMLIKKKAR